MKIGKYASNILGLILIIGSFFLTANGQSLKERYLNPMSPSSTLDSGFTSWQLENRDSPDKRMLHAIPEKPDRYMRKIDPGRLHDSIMSERSKGPLNKFEDRDIFLKERRGSIPNIERYPDSDSGTYKYLQPRYPEAFSNIQDGANAEITSCGEGNVPKMGDIDIVRKAWVQRYAGDLFSPNDIATDMAVDLINRYVVVTG